MLLSDRACSTCAPGAPCHRRVHDHLRWTPPHCVSPADVVHMAAVECPLLARPCKSLGTSWALDRTSWTATHP